MIHLFFPLLCLAFVLTGCGQVIDQAATQPSTQNSNETISQQQPVTTQEQPAAPIAGFREKVTKKPFGIFITPQNSPIQPERFSGYHSGADAEVGDEQDVPVSAVAAGEIILKKTASGYGGVLVVVHEISGETYSAVYGHLDLSSVTKNSGDMVSAGERIGVLGQAFSAETDGERAHLHFALRRGRSTDIRGYAASEEELQAWVDPVSFFGE